MSVHYKQGDPPFVIDYQMMPAMFERAPGVRNLVAADDQPARFDTPEEAEEFLHEHLTRQELAENRWTILPESEV